MLAGRIAAHVNRPRAAIWLHLRAWRNDRRDGEAAYFYAYALLTCKGPLAAHRFASRFSPAESEPLAVRANWLSMRAEIASYLRDFEAAEEFQSQAEALTPESPWIWVSRSRLAEKQDRRDESLVFVQRALSLRPWYRPAVQSMAELLSQLDRDRESLEFLTEASRHLESTYVEFQLAQLHGTLGNHDVARDVLEAAAARYPPGETNCVRSLTALRSDFAYQCGDYATAEKLARESGDPYYLAIANRLAKAGTNSRRVVLPFGFVRQHHLTCVPATLSAIARYWSQPFVHQQIADEICYDGTPSYRERQWANENGWVAREFTVTWESARTLIDRNIPFSLTTIEPTSGHVQAVIGYDERRQVLIVQDPGARPTTEWLATEMLERYRSTGPRGLVLVPAEQANLLTDIRLPDAGLYDQLFALQLSLSFHERKTAHAKYMEMLEESPDHRLTLMARRQLAAYDGDHAMVLTCTERLLAISPEDSIHEATKSTCLRLLSRRADRVELLSLICARPNPAPVFLVQLAEELAVDARESRRAERLLKRALRRQPFDAAIYFGLASLSWDERRIADSTQLFRIAACLSEHNERYANAYFAASRHAQQTEQGLGFLRRRVVALGKSSTQPVQTLFAALCDTYRQTEAFDALESALARHPSDGDLLLFAADAYSRTGATERAKTLLRAADARCHRGAWLRTAAELARYSGDHPTALACLQEILTIEPQAVDVHIGVAQLLARTQGTGAAIDHLSGAVQRFPHNMTLRQQWILWLREDDPTRHREETRQYVHINPLDAWARRELALALGRSGNMDEAHAELEIGLQLDPTNPAGWMTKGELAALAGDAQSAKCAFRKTLELSIDQYGALSTLMEVCGTAAERRAELSFAHEQLKRQVVFGDGLMFFYDAAQHDYSAEELLQVLRDGMRARPDLYHAWALVIKQLTRMSQLDDAEELAESACRQFPLTPGAWRELASVYQARNDLAQAVRAMERTLEISPNWSAAARQLAEIHRANGATLRARGVLERAASREPLDAINHGVLAELLWHEGERTEAVDRVRRAAIMEPRYDWAWDALTVWSAELGQPDLAEQLVQELVEKRSGDATCWMLLARVVKRADALDERLAALDRAAKLRPAMEEIYDLKAQLLAEHGRYVEARAACRPSAIDDSLAKLLRGRTVWITYLEGRVDEAIADMRRILEKDPSYWVGWIWLSDWYWSRQAYAMAADACEHAVRLAPDNGWCWARLGDARHASGDPTAAIDAFSRAAALDLSQHSALRSLIDLLLDQNKLVEAAARIEQLSTTESAFAESRRLRLEVLRGEPAKAVRIFETMCANSDFEQWAIEAGVQALDQGGCHQDVQTVLDAALRQGACNSAIPAVWASRHLSAGGFKRVRRALSQFSVGSIPWLLATNEFFTMARGRAYVYAAVSFLRKHRKILHRHTPTWGTGGWLLLQSGKTTAVCKWLADWRERKDAQPWMLLNLGVALRARGRFAAATAVNRHATQLPADHTSPCHQTIVAFEEACCGNSEAAAGRLSQVDQTKLAPYYQTVQAITTALVDIWRQSAAANSQPSFWTAWKQLRQKTRPFKARLADDTSLRHLYFRARHSLAKQYGGAVMRFVMGYRKLTYAIVIFVVVFVAIALFLSINDTRPRR